MEDKAWSIVSKNVKIWFDWASQRPKQPQSRVVWSPRSLLARHRIADLVKLSNFRKEETCPKRILYVKATSFWGFNAWIGFVCGWSWSQILSRSTQGVQSSPQQVMILLDHEPMGLLSNCYIAHLEKLSNLTKKTLNRPIFWSFGIFCLCTQIDLEFKSPCLCKYLR